MRIKTLIQWHTEQDGVITWHEPGEVADVTVSDLADLLAIGTVAQVMDDPQPAKPALTRAKVVQDAPSTSEREAQV